MFYNFIGFNVISLRGATFIARCHWLKLEMMYIHLAISRVIDRSLIVAVVRESSLVSKVNMYLFKFASLSYHSFRSFYVAEGEKSLGTCFRSSERKAVSTPPFQIDFTQHSSGRFERQIFASLSYSGKNRVALCSQIKPIACCGLYGIGIRFGPNNLKRKAQCGSD